MGEANRCSAWSVAAAGLLTVATTAWAQAPSQGTQAAATIQSPAQVGQTSTAGTSYQGSVVEEKATATVLPLTLDDAIQRGLKQNLGLILTTRNGQSANGERLQYLQGLLPTVNGSLKEAVQQTNLEAEGLRIPGFPTIIGPYGYTDLRGSLSWSLLNVASLKNYLASKHNFQGAQLSAQDARDLVVLTVGNAYLTCIADAARIQSVQAQVDTSKVSLDQAQANHQAGIAPLLDELRARVDYQTQQQTLISTQNQYEKDKIALARAIGLPLEQKFQLTDQAPYAALDELDPDTATAGIERRSDLKSPKEQVAGAKDARSAATAERLSHDFLQWRLRRHRR